MRGDNYVTESGHRVIPIRENRGEKYFIVIILLYMFLEKNKLYRPFLFPLEGFKQNPSAPRENQIVQ